jgi:hypothetical protein
MSACTGQPQAVARLRALEPQVSVAHSGGTNHLSQQIQWQYTDLSYLTIPNFVL